jgi:glycosyltransferase involved in cell wall biosynthesis
MKPRILFLCTACPFGEISGAGLRTRGIARILNEIGTMTMVSATERHIARQWTDEQVGRTTEEFNLGLRIRYQDDPAKGPVDRLRKIFDPRFLNSNGVVVGSDDRLAVEKLVADHDIVWLHTLKLANAFLRFEWPQTIADVDDFPSGFHASAANYEPTLLKRMMRRQRAYSSKRSERLSLERFSLLAVCKEIDRAAFGDPSRVHVIPNGFEIPDLPMEEVVPVVGRLGMIGDFGYLPNHDGLRWFINRVWPAVLQVMPSANLHLVGKGSVEVAREYAGQGVIGLGYVTDPTGEMASWSGMIVPTRLGGGTHLKVVEALARGIPLVATSHGARGYTLVNGQHALLGDTPEEFALQCMQILGDPLLGKHLGAAGRKLFRERYSWDSIKPSVERAVEHCLALKAAR